jgi:multidrug efflux pump subunit AcrB
LVPAITFVVMAYAGISLQRISLGALIIALGQPQNASITETNAQIARFEREQLEGNPGVDHWSTYVGTGAPRFVLSLDVQTANTWFGQMVVVTNGGIAARDRVKAQFETYLRAPIPSSNCSRSALQSDVRCNTA